MSGNAQTVTIEFIRIIVAVVVTAFGVYFFMDARHDPSGAANASRLVSEITTYRLFKEKAEGQIETYTRKIIDSNGMDFASEDRRADIRVEREEYMDEIALRTAELNALGIFIPSQ
tara:strand:+ start:372 stop:719 length:348 start_codon:yes stop_codon:yes gene_type:complete